MDVDNTIKFSTNSKEDFGNDIMIKSEPPEIVIVDEMHFLKEEQDHLTNSSIKSSCILPINGEPSKIDIFDEMHFLKEEQNHLTNSSIKGNSVLLLNEVDTLKIPVIKLSRLYWCNKCQRNFKTAEILRHHKEKHGLIEKPLTDPSGSTTTPYTCPECKKDFISFSGLKKHITAKHKPLNPSQRRSFDCNVCKGKFSIRSNLERHLLSDSHCSIHYKCPSCVKGFLTTEGLEKHIHGNCLDQSSEYNIARTKNIISTELFKQQRENCQTVGSGHPYFCDICLQFFLKKDYLDAHRKRHAMNKSIVCKVCGKIFWNRSTLKKHQRNLTEENPYFECEFCKLKLCSRTILLLHYKTHLCNSRKITSTNALLKTHDKKNMLSPIKDRIDFQPTIFSKDNLKTCKSKEIVVALQRKSENQDKDDRSLDQEQRMLGKLTKSGNSILSSVQEETRDPSALTESENSFLFFQMEKETFDPLNLNNEMEICDVKIELEE